MKYNLLTEPLITADMVKSGRTALSLPAIFAALIRDEIADFPALRPHQAQAWHCFLAQLGALALHRAEQNIPPHTMQEWETLLRGLTSDFLNDAPWHLVGADADKPAFLQPPEPVGIVYTGRAETPDALDMLIGQKNHDVKEKLYQESRPEDWIFALISKQTGDGFNGAGNYGIARMNGGSSSRFSMGLCPLSDKTSAPTPGARLTHDITLLLSTRASQLSDMAALDFPERGGKTLLWLTPWPLEERQGLCLNTLDIWFIEICRRIRLHGEGDRLIAKTGTSKAPRVDAKTQKGVVGDPWAPVNVKDRKSLTLGPSKLDYHHICDWLFGGNWQAPAMIRKADMSDTNQNWALIIQALGRGNCKTYGYHERTLVLPRQSAARLITDAQALHTLSQDLIKDIGELKKILGHAIAIAAIDGRSTSPDKDKYAAAKPWQDGLDLMADRHFFPALWDMLPAYLHKDYAAQDEAKHRFFRRLIKEAQTLLNTAIETVSAAQFHLRARSRAERVFRARIGKHFDWYFSNDNKEANDAAA